MIAWFMAAPVLVKVLASLGLILAVNRLTKSLLVAVPVATLALGVWCGRPLLGGGDAAASPDEAAGMIGLVGRAVFNPDNLMLMAVIFLVVWLSGQMRAAGVMRDLVTAVRARMSRRAGMAALPAVIGFLPMPGGALFSAPLVDSCDENGEVAPLVKAQTNYWFRHLWEYWWPIYPGVLMMLHQTGLEPWQIVLLHLPLTCASAAGGYWFLLRRIPRPAVEAHHAHEGPKPPVLPLLTPILIVIGVYAALKTGLPAVEEAGRYLPMMLGLLAAIGVLQRMRPLAGAVWKELVSSMKTVRLVAIVLAIQVYGAFIEAPLADGVRPAARMSAELDAWGIPALLVIALLPWLTGLVTGIAVAMAGASFPIVLGLLPEDPSTPTLLATTALAYGCGYVGMMISPVHVCLIVTNEHFATRLGRSIAGLLPPAAVNLAATALLYLAVSRLGPLFMG